MSGRDRAWNNHGRPIWQFTPVRISNEFRTSRRHHGSSKQSASPLDFFMLQTWQGEWRKQRKRISACSASLKSEAISTQFVFQTRYHYGSSYRTSFYGRCIWSTLHHDQRQVSPSTGPWPAARSKTSTFGESCYLPTWNLQLPTIVSRVLISVQLLLLWQNPNSALHSP